MNSNYILTLHAYTDNLNYSLYLIVQINARRSRHVPPAPKGNINH